MVGSTPFPRTFTVTGTAGANGSIGPASSTVNQGATAALTVTPDAGYSIGTVSGCNGSLSGTTYTTGGITADCTVTASFIDTTPDAFSFTDQSNVIAGDVATSNSITVSGIDTATAITVSDGEYAIDGAAFTSAAGTVANGQSVAVRHTATALFETVTSTLLTIGGVSDTFSSTTGPIGTGFNRAREFNSTVLSLSPATDGSGDVYVGGSFTTYNSSGSNRIIRLNSDGTVDTAFAVGTGFNSTVRTISAATDGSGDVYVGGDSTSYNGTGSNRLIRLNSDGTVDTAFAVGMGFSSAVLSLSPATDGSDDVFAGGDFLSYQTTTVDRIVRLNPDGSLN